MRESAGGAISGFNEGIGKQTRRCGVTSEHRLFETAVFQEEACKITEPRRERNVWRFSLLGLIAGSQATSREISTGIRISNYRSYWRRLKTWPCRERLFREEAGRGANVFKTKRSYPTAGWARIETTRKGAWFSFREIQRALARAWTRI